MEKYWIVIALCVSSFCSSDGQGPTAEFSNTTVQGIVKTTRLGRDVDSFLGIPYAEPPIGPLRFSDPIPKMYPDGGTLIADKPPIRCLQSILSVIGDANSPRYIKGDEDCLYLNIHRPASAGNQTLPVMVYFQAADLFPGNEDVAYIGPDYLLDQDVILVTLTYRLAVFGFLGLGDEVIPGNFGLKDQKLALQWVQSNIAGFGGDPNRVTLFGQGEAAKLIHIQALVNHTEGLFHQYILQSGNALAPWAVHDYPVSRRWARKLALLNKCPNWPEEEMVDCLRKVDSRQLLESSYKQFSIADINFNRLWGPIREEPWESDTYLSDCPTELIARGWQRDLPFIAGLDFRENNIRVSADSGDDDWGDQNAGAVDDTFHSLLGYSETHHRIQKFYLWENLDGDGPIQVGVGYGFVLDTVNDYFGRFERFLDDFTHNAPQVKMLKERRKNSKSPFYFYSFEYQGQFRTADWLYHTHGVGDATHGDELLYLFYHDKAEFPNSARYKMSRYDYQMIDTMVELWTSFATGGVPWSHNIEYDWEPYGSEGEYLQIGIPPGPRTEPRSNYHWKRMSYWENFTMETCY